MSSNVTFSAIECASEPATGSRNSEDARQKDSIDSSRASEEAETSTTSDTSRNFDMLRFKNNFMKVSDCAGESKVVNLVHFHRWLKNCV